MIDIKKLIQIAIDNKEKAYCPYSNFRVSSVVRSKSGEIFEGVNIESASYPASICAERSALAAAISQGHKEFSHIIITGDSIDTYPCGVCRQFMAEFLDDESEIIIANTIDDYKVYKIDEILPHSFSKKDLS